ncbi:MULTISPECIES: mannonate dehydratase [unclassified Sphingomonas]|uniref:mannonate dehydratase n=1 Tax=unclassified Sphingomonas TaxID=196159 RepID=UPI000A8DD609|nr:MULTISPECIES: mannonate dehydratase [unclassified Sphingomonas]
MRMRQTMRWFGPSDPVSLRDIRQAGCSGVVSALHAIPNGEVWPVEAIRERQALIEAAGMTWDVVESLPVSEAIKTAGPERDAHVAAYRESLTNLAECGIRVITYNFMPVLDWTRTDLGWELLTGAKALRFELDAVAAYDVHMLRRAGAEAAYDAATLERAAARFAGMDEGERTALERTIIAGLPGSEEGFTTADFAQALSSYAGIDAGRLAEHHVAFLRDVCPHADALGVQLVVHPDDPPMPLFGLPRVVSTAADLDRLFAAVPNASNGLCLCTGSLGVRPDNDLPAMVERFGSRIGFLHLRNVAADAPGAFHEAEHLDGQVDMVAVVQAVHKLSVAEGRSIPMRPDHGHQMLDDLAKSGSNPGYTAIGRLRGLAELRGLERGVEALSKA